MRQKKDTTRINGDIDASEVRVISAEGQQVGIVPIDEALQIAEDAGFDLVEVSPDASPPVCRIMDYGKYRFQQSKKMQDARRKQKTVQVKAVKFRPRIDEHDYQTKFRHIIKFLDAGNKVRAFVHFRGREMAHKDIGLKILQRILEDVGERGVVEKQPQMEGRQMFMLVNPAPTVKK